VNRQNNKLLNKLPKRLKVLSAIAVIGGLLPVVSFSQDQESAVLPAPRFANGMVNLGLPPGQKGFWGSSGSIFGRGRLSHETNLLAEELPFQPWAKALYEYRRANNQADDPHSRCVIPGPTRLIETVNGFEILPMPDINRVYFVFGGGPHTWRVIYTDNRPLPDIDDPDTIPVYMGYTSAHWEGDTLVVESNGFNEKSWFAQGGIPHTRFLHLTERFSRPDFETLRYEATVDDPGAYTRTWQGGFDVKWTYNSWDGTDAGEIHEYFCQDNNRDIPHMVGN
jgi:hypothetical protein